MKILLFALLVPFLCNSQTANLPKNADGMVEYTEVVNVDSISADKLFSNAKLFIGKEAASAKDVIRMQDDATKTVIIKGNIPVGSDAFIDISLTISCKENKYKYSITDIVFEWISQRVKTPIESDKSYIMFVSKKQWNKAKEQMQEKIYNYIDDLKSAMKRHNSDW